MRDIVREFGEFLKENKFSDEELKEIKLDVNSIINTRREVLRTKNGKKV